MLQRSSSEPYPSPSLASGATVAVSDARFLANSWGALHKAVPLCNCPGYNGTTEYLSIAHKICFVSSSFRLLLVAAPRGPPQRVLCSRSQHTVCNFTQSSSLRLDAIHQIYLVRIAQHERVCHQSPRDCISSFPLSALQHTAWSVLFTSRGSESYSGIPRR